MQKDRRQSMAIALFILIGVVGLPAGIYQLIVNIQSGWVCYSKHGHILETVAGCKFNLFAGLLVCTAALVIGLYQALRRR